MFASHSARTILIAINAIEETMRQSGMDFSLLSSVLEESTEFKTILTSACTTSDECACGCKSQFLTLFPVISA